MQEYYPNLDYFITIAEEKTLTHAAAKLAVSQQSLTSYLKRLEDFYQTPLLVREYRKLALTPFGEKAYESALKIRSLNRQLMEEGKQRNMTPATPFRIGGMRPNAATLMRLIPMAEFSKIHPLARFDLQEDLGIRLEQNLMDHKLDLILAYECPKLKPPQYDSYPLDKTTLQFCISETLLRQHFPDLKDDTLQSWETEGIVLNNFLSIPVILPPDHSFIRRQLEMYLGKEHQQFHHITCCDDYSLSLYMCLNNMGATFISCSAFGQDIYNNTLNEETKKASLYRFIIREPKIQRTISLYYRHESMKDYLFRELVDMIMKRFSHEDR